MGTCNFRNHENGIFVVDQETEEYVITDILEQIAEYDGEEALKEANRLLEDDENAFKSYHHVYERWADYDAMNVKDTLDNIRYDLEAKGYMVTTEDRYALDVYNNKDKWVARIYPESGYYDGYQIIVDTDGWERFTDYYDTQTELFEQFTPNHKRVLKVVAEYTTPIRVVGIFSNGEAVYEKL